MDTKPKSKDVDAVAGNGDLDSNYLVLVECHQPANIKSAFAALKEQLAEANLDFSPEGLEILQMDPTHIVLAQKKLFADKFEKFICKQPVRVGIDIVNFNKVLKGVGAKDILTFFYEDPSRRIGTGDETDAGQSFGIRIENTDKGQTSTVYIDTIDVNDEGTEVPELNYPYTIEMPSADLQAIIGTAKNMVAEIIQIRLVKDKIYFYAKGELGRLETVKSKTCKEENSITIRKGAEYQNTDEIIEIYVKLQKLVEFTKCSSLSNMVSIYLKNDHPLFLEYDVGSLGFIKLGISPHARPDNW